MVEIPKTYQQVSYIESDGTNWLNIIRAHTNDDEYELVVSFPYAPTQTYYKVFGEASNNYSSNDCIQLEADDNDGGFHFRIVWYPEYGKNFGPIEIGKKYKLTINNSSAISLNEIGNLNGSNTYSGNLATTPTKTDYLFTVNSSEISSHACKCRIYSFRIIHKNSRTISVWLIPCYDKNSGMIGFYDKARNQFLSNVAQGTGSNPFTYGIEEEESIYENFIINCGTRTVTKNVPTNYSGSVSATRDSSYLQSNRWYAEIQPSNAVFDITQYSVNTLGGSPLNSIKYFTTANGFLIEGYTAQILKGATITYTYRYLTQQQITEGETWDKVYNGGVVGETYKYTYKSTGATKNLSSYASALVWNEMTESFQNKGNAVLDHGASHDGYPHRYEMQYIITPNNTYDLYGASVSSISAYILVGTAPRITYESVNLVNLTASLCKARSGSVVSDYIFISGYAPSDDYPIAPPTSTYKHSISYSYQRLGDGTHIKIQEPYNIISDKPLSGPATRSEVLTYFTNMTAPSISVNENAQTVTLTFNPIPENIAEGMLEHKMIQFRIVRNKAHSTKHRKIKRGTNPANAFNAKNWVKEYFPYRFSYDNDICNAGPYSADVTILNSPQEQETSVITKQELMAGTLTRNISHIYNLIPFSHSNNYNINRDAAAHYNSGWVYSQFYIGFIYYNEDSKPTDYQMNEYLLKLYEV